MFRLPPYRLLPGDAEPAEILIDRGLELRPAPDGVDILDAQQQPAAAPAPQASMAAGENKR